MLSGGRTLGTRRWGDCSGPGEGIVWPQGGPRDNLLQAFARPGVALEEQGTRLEGTRRTTSPSSTLLPFLQTPGHPAFPQALGSGSWVSAAPLAHGVSRTQAPAHRDWQHQRGHRDLGEEERGVMHRRVRVERR